MNDKLTELVFILDRSGSMGGLEEDTIGGFNAMLEKQKQEPGEALVSTVLFDHDRTVLHDRVPVGQVEPITEEQYFVRGSTALLDALGGAIHHIATVHHYAREEDRPGKTVFVITTDGCENASRAYTFPEVREMVKKEQEKYGWEFLFLGANMDAIAAAGEFGIRADRAVRFRADHEGVQLNYASVSRTLSAMRTVGRIGDDWAEEIEADFKKRG